MSEFNIHELKLLRIALELAIRDNEQMAIPPIDRRAGDKELLDHEREGKLLKQLNRKVCKLLKQKRGKDTPKASILLVSN